MPASLCPSPFHSICSRVQCYLMSFAVVPAAALAVSAFTYKLVWLDEHNVSTNQLDQDGDKRILISPSNPVQTLSLRKLVEVCLTNSNGWLSKSITSSSFKPSLSDILCTRLAFMKQLFGHRSGHGVSGGPSCMHCMRAYLYFFQIFLIYGSILFPLILRLCYTAASPNKRNMVPSVLLPALAFLLTSSSTLLLGIGLGVFIPPIIGLLYAASSSISQKASSAVPLPAVTRAVYGSNLAIIASSVLFLLQLGSGAGQDDEDMALLEYYVSKDVYQVIDFISGIFADVFPLLVSLPLVFLGLKGLQRPKGEREATTYLKENYLASEVAYGFERTWA